MASPPDRRMTVWTERCGLAVQLKYCVSFTNKCTINQLKGRERVHSNGDECHSESSAANSFNRGWGSLLNRNSLISIKKCFPEPCGEQCFDVTEYLQTVWLLQSVIYLYLLALNSLTTKSFWNFLIIWSSNVDLLARFPRCLIFKKN